MLWTLAGEMDRRGEAAPALLRVIDLDLRRGEFESGLQFWDELREHAPDARVEPGLLVRLALALQNTQRGDEASTLPRNWDFKTATCWSPSITRRSTVRKK